MRQPIALAAVAVIAMALVAPAIAARREWIGDDACGACHPAELAAWRLTPHAGTGTRLPARPAGRCLGCHATGEAPAGPTVALGVGCEACHGAGASYAELDVMLDDELARLLGLEVLETTAARTAVCTRCHVEGLRQTAASLEVAVPLVHATSGPSSKPGATGTSPIEGAP